MPNNVTIRIAVVHDELTRRGGAETVLEELLEVFPQADVFALYAGKPIIRVGQEVRPVRTTFIQHLPRWFRRHPSRVLPLLPFAAEQIDLAEYDLVISSSSGFAKNIITRAAVPHVSYCHTPTRYLWEESRRAVSRTFWPLRLPARLLLHWLRLSDYAGAQRVDYFIANSQWTSARIKKYYGRSSAIIFPPVDTTFYTPGKSIVINKPFLCVGRLTPSKNFDQAIIACEKLGLPLNIVGQGPQLKTLLRLSGRHTKFLGKLTRQQLRDQYRSARALLQPGVEDFGIASAEAQACGLAVVGFNAGGIREIVKSFETGLLYAPAKVENLAEALRQFISTLESKLDREQMQKHAFSFNRERFHTEIQAAINNIISENKLPDNL